MTRPIDEFEERAVAEARAWAADTAEADAAETFVRGLLGAPEDDDPAPAPEG